MTWRHGSVLVLVKYFMGMALIDCSSNMAAYQFKYSLGPHKNTFQGSNVHPKRTHLLGLTYVVTSVVKQLWTLFGCASVKV